MAQQRWTITVNGQSHVLDVDGQTPLLYILQDQLGLKGPRFGCGLAQCGSCSVLVDDREIRACVTPLAAVAGRAVTTLEGVAAWHARRRRLARTPDMHPVQQALLEAEAPQCGYCMNGIVMKSAELLDQNPHPTEQEIRAALSGHLCRCGTYPSILKAVQKAAKT
jgi:aerobic-type carbon monoxide dehydrogenase small subunit (CoxS/CutS family)